MKCINFSHHNAYSKQNSTKSLFKLVYTDLSPIIKKAIWQSLKLNCNWLSVAEEENFCGFRILITFVLLQIMFVVFEVEAKNNSVDNMLKKP